MDLKPPKTVEWTSSLLFDNRRRLLATDTPYLLPSDNVEHERLDYQHYAIARMMGDILPEDSGADGILSRNEQGCNPRVLDIGAGSGAWAIEVANKYPNAQVVAIDLSPLDLEITLPPNFSFELLDVEFGFEELGRFDVIHARAVLQGIKDYETLFENIVKALNPGGVFISIEGETGLSNKEKIKYGPQKEGDPDFSWSQKLTMDYLEANLKRNPSFSNLSKVAEILKSTPGEPWETIKRTEFFLPCGAYELEDPKERVAGALMQESSLKIPRALEKLLVHSGFEPSYVRKVTTSALREIEECEVVNYLKWIVVSAKKKAE
ncbi:hypothetical protein FRB90_009617 [Tulasnella sp. 427]|nr:hypothetical protein FRB90_009617 [Tulasnella sp. 427]